MLWFFWRRVRLGVLVTGIVLATVAALVVVAGSIGPASRHHAAGRTVVSRSGAQVRKALVSRASAKAVDHGVTLMSAAVIACRTVSYSGVQMVAWWGTEDSTTYLIQVWHASGEPEVADGAGGQNGQRGSIAEPGMAAADHATAGVLSVSSWMLSLLRSNYLIEYAGNGTADSRTASIVTVRRDDGSLAARYWLDEATGLPLRREMFDSNGHLVGEGAFIDVNFGGVSSEPVPPRIAQAWSAQPTKKDLSMLRRQGWPVPSRLAGNMALVGVSQAMPTSGQVLDASYSDGLSVVSVFMQRGELAGKLPGWSRTVVNGTAVYSSEPDQRSLAWSADGVVYTVISDAPQGTVDEVVGQLPHDRGGGVWQRVGRGLRRMGSWLNPFK
jgi:sigma-E factor negative regulatory protein RseB